MRKAIYYLILSVLVMLTLIAVPAILDVVFNVDLKSVGVKGLTAGTGIAVLTARGRLFAWFDKISSKKKESA